MNVIAWSAAKGKARNGIAHLQDKCTKGINALDTFQMVRCECAGSTAYIQGIKGSEQVQSNGFRKYLSVCSYGVACGETRLTKANDYPRNDCWVWARASYMIPQANSIISQ